MNHLIANSSSELSGEAEVLSRLVTASSPSSQPSDDELPIFAAHFPPPAAAAAPTMMVTLPTPQLEIAPRRSKNEKGRFTCRVVGCNKLDQCGNNGFCRGHFNMIGVHTEAAAASSYGGVEGAPWSCQCGNVISFKQDRCGKCHRWKGGNPPAKDDDVDECSNANDNNYSMMIASDTESLGEGTWTCGCGIQLEASKTRCGKCYKWKGGKRKAGWKLGDAMTNNDNKDGIDWTQDWSCCSEIISAKRTRCGKCFSWRGGKRRSKVRDGKGKTKVAAADSDDEDEKGYSLKRMKSSSSMPSPETGGVGSLMNVLECSNQPFYCGEHSYQPHTHLAMMPMLSSHHSATLGNLYGLGSLPTPVLKKDDDDEEEEYEAHAFV